MDEWSEASNHCNVVISYLFRFYIIICKIKNIGHIYTICIIKTLRMLLGKDHLSRDEDNLPSFLFLLKMFFFIVILYYKASCKVNRILNIYIINISQFKISVIKLKKIIGHGIRFLSLISYCRLINSYLFSVPAVLVNWTINLRNI